MSNKCIECKHFRIQMSWLGPKDELTIHCYAKGGIMRGTKPIDASVFKKVEKVFKATDCTQYKKQKND